PDLIDLYFKHIHPYLLVLHKPSFFRRLHDPRDPVPDFLLAAMYAVASHYAPGREQDGRQYFEFWLSRLDDALDKPRLSTIQSLLMVIKYQEGVKSTGFYFRTYMYTQMVIVLARPRLIARISCQECRRRKTRCNFDGQSQKCSTCARIGTPCIFSQKNGVILDIDKVMEENNPHLLHQREKEQRAKERAKLSAISPSTSSSSSSTLHSTLAPAPVPNTSIYSKSTPSSSYLSGARFSHNKPNRSNSILSASAGHSGRSSSNEETEELSSVLDRLQIDAFGIAPHTLRSFSQVAGDNDSAQVSAESSETESEHPHKSEAHDEAKPTLNKRNSTGS
ncbi:hypothetical protein BGZ79_005193, partial [Entomortierella chlamydospora]